MKTITCEICGKKLLAYSGARAPYEDSMGYSITLRNRSAYPAERNYDFCPECIENGSFAKIIQKRVEESERMYGRTGESGNPYQASSSPK